MTEERVGKSTKGQQKRESQSKSRDSRAYVVEKVSADNTNNGKALRIVEVRQARAESYPPCLKLHQVRPLSI